MKFSKPLSLDDILQIIEKDVIVKGNTKIQATGINEIHSVEPGDISFVDIPKYYDKLLQSSATVVLIDKETDVPDDKAIIITKDPLENFLKIVRHFTHFSPQKEAIHPLAKIGKNTVIQPNCFIGENVIIGDDCIIHSNVSVYNNTTIGNRVIIHSGAVIGGDAYYFQRRNEGWKKLDSCGCTWIDDDVEIGSNVSIDKGVSGCTYIGKGCKFDNLVQVGHDTHIGNHCLICSQSAIAGCSFIDDNCTIWAKSCINKDLYIAPNTTLLALSALDKSVTEPNQTLFGLPAIDARQKWKEMVLLRRMPELLETFEFLLKTRKTEQD
jgi:UDP-3-O-[3-hydroxymyristoyl] glucosamine N-acyltransferase